MGTVLGHDIDTSMLITLDSNTWGLGLVVSLFGTLCTANHLFLSLD